jgi:hypothetical protein
VTQAIPTLLMLHLSGLCLWGGVVLTEAVLELYPHRRPDLHGYTVELHYWIDLLVELPLIIGVATTGGLLVAAAWPLSALHVVKILCAAVAVGANVYCIRLVLARRKALRLQGDDVKLWLITRRIVLSAMVGLPFAAAAAGLGFWLAWQRLG